MVIVLRVPRAKLSIFAFEAAKVSDGINKVVNTKNKVNVFFFILSLFTESGGRNFGDDIA